MERQSSAPFIQRFTYNLITKDTSRDYRNKNINNAPSELLIFNKNNKRLSFSSKPPQSSTSSSNQRLTPIQERMKNLLTNLINNRSLSNQPPSPKINKDLHEGSVSSHIHKEKINRKREEIVNLMGGGISHRSNNNNNNNKGNKKYLSFFSNNGKNTVMNGIQREVNQILGNMNKIVNAQPEYLRYPKTNNDFSFLSNRRIERSNSNYFKGSISNSNSISSISQRNYYTSSLLNKSPSTTSKLNYNYNSSYNSSNANSIYYSECSKPMTSCQYHNDRYIKMKLGLTSL